MSQSRIITAFLIAMWLLTPEVLCLVPGVELTMEEHECCRLMGGQCGQMPMPSFHKCCQPVTRSNVVVTAKATDYPELRVANLPFVSPGPGLSPEAAFVAHWLDEAASTSPPPLTPHESIDILRI